MPTPEGYPRYFTIRETTESIRETTETKDFEKIYWGEIVDPDGCRRNRLKEREQCLEDVYRELTFVNNLIPGKLLDVGCGPGFFLSGVNDRWEKYGVEISQFAAEHARKWGKIHLGDIKSAGYADNFFDVVILHHVVEHLKEPVAALREVRRILKPNGKIILGTPDFDSGCARRFGKNYRLLNDPTHISLFSLDSMQRLLRDLGFIVDEVDFPFFETRHFTVENLKRLFDISKISPPFYGNFMTFYCKKPHYLKTTILFLRLGLVLPSELEILEKRISSVMDLLAKATKVWIMAERLKSLSKWVNQELPVALKENLNFKKWRQKYQKQMHSTDKSDLFLLAPTTKKEISDSVEIAEKKFCRIVFVIPEDFTVECDAYDLIMHVPTIEGLPSGAIQFLAIEALILDFSEFCC
jgi:SAM-dependent methyltransferase